MIILTPVDVSVYGVTQFETLYVKSEDGDLLGVIRCKDLIENQTDESDWYAFRDSESELFGRYPDKESAADALLASPRA